MMKRLKTIIVSACVSIFCCGAGHASLIGFYTLDGNTLDSSGNGNNGTVHGSVAYTLTTPWGTSALTLDGASKNNFVSVPIDSTVSGQPTETFGGWFYVPTGAPTTEVRGLISNDDGDFDRTLDVDNRIVGFQWSVFTGQGIAGGDNVTEGQWTFVAVSYDNSGGNNGSYVLQVGPDTFTGSTGFDGNSVSGVTSIGINPNFDFEFNGGIADVFFYNTALTAAQLANIAQNGPSAITTVGTTPSGVPEPGTVGLLAAGLLGMRAIRKICREYPRSEQAD